MLTLAPAPPRQAATPRLVVVVVVDQMRADYLDRFGPLFKGGFARLAREGTVFTEARHDHAATETAPGHATIATGRFPSRHGIVANNWYDRAEGRIVYAVDDSTAMISGRPGDRGRSPSRLLGDGLTDWLKQGSPQSKVVAVALKDRASILMGARRPDAVYWYNPTTGHFQTSSYYMKQVPAWLDSLNQAGLADQHFAEGWKLLLEPAAYTASGPDSVPWENDGIDVTFPHRLDTAYTGSRAGSYAELPYTPFGDEVTLTVARNAVIRDALGADSIPDILWLGCSSGDYVGHRYGPSSREVQDYYLRLDAYLGEFFTFLDERVGAGRYAIALSADHAVMPVPEDLVRQGLPGKRVTRGQASAEFQKAERDVGRDLKISDPIFAGYAEGILLRNSAATTRGITVAQLQEGAAKRLRRIPFIADAYTATELAASTGSNRQYLEQFRHNFYPGRSADVSIRYKEYVLSNTDAVHGTSHGAPYDYDARVPIVFLGAGMTPGKRTARVKTVDIAPTIARMLGITVPPDLDGKALN